MKKFLFIIVLVVVAMTTQAQKYYSLPANDTVASDTNYLPSATGYDLKNIESGVFSYTFTKADVADSLSYARIEYRNSTSDTWAAYTGTGALAATTTDGKTRLYVGVPLIDRYIRVAIACASGDSVAVTGQVLMLKED